MYISEGNKKLGRNDKEYFLIWNLPSVKTCPNKTPMCEKACYARKAERLYPQVLPCRERNLMASLKPQFVSEMMALIKKEVGRRKNKDKKCYFRIHESGDFYSMTYFQKWAIIAELMPDIQFMAYTKSVPFVKQYVEVYGAIPSNLLVRYSLWADSPAEGISIASDMGLPMYTAFPKKEIEKIQADCPAMVCSCDCTTCKKCYDSTNVLLAVAIH